MTGKSNVLKAIRECFLNLEGPDKVKELAGKALDSNIEPLSLINIIKEGLDGVGEKYDSGEYFLSDLVMSGVMASELINLVKPRLKASDAKPVGRVVIGTVKGDIHDIGKNLVINMLTAQGFDVIDVGVDVAPEKFLESVEKFKPTILAMSCLLTTGMEEMSRTVQLLKENVPKVKAMVGGRPISKEFADGIGADGYGKEAFEAIDVAKRLVGDGRNE